MKTGITLTFLRCKLGVYFFRPSLKSVLKFSFQKHIERLNRWGFFGVSSLKDELLGLIQHH